mmetsp:Transcript_18789/g.23392  ORF Transcript_18789/g.23392 Transcript_18789/m.23392 type:complete len:127 (+) Transcript_18789:663-1043(+)
MMRDIYGLLMGSHLDGLMDNIIVIRKIPKAAELGNESQTYTKEWILEHLFSVLAKHQAVVLDPKRDVQVLDDEEQPDKFYSVVLVLDGFSHMREMDHEPDEDEDRSKMLKLLYSETDDEGDGEVEP